MEPDPGNTGVGNAEHGGFFTESAAFFEGGDVENDGTPHLRERAEGSALCPGQ